MTIKNKLRRTLAVVAVLWAGTALADLAQTVEFNIAPQPLQEALIKYSAQSGVQVTTAAEIIDGKASAGVIGTYPAQGALEQLLKGTALGFDVINGNTVTIHRTAGDRTVSGTQAQEDNDVRLAQGKSSPDVYGSAQVSEQKQNLEDTALDEVVVTAQKRIERLQEVPVPVTALSADILAANNQLRLQDYYTKVPGLNLVLTGDGDAPTLSIRGVTTGGFTNPTVGTVIDEVSYGSTIAQGSSANAPDIDPSELTRIEVLRGPQGALYGASGIGGLIKFVTIDPSTDGLSGHVQTGFNSIRNGDGTGYNLRGAINVPLGDTFAVRASGFTGRDPGYVDNVRNGEEGVNQRDNEGGRLSALWRPSENLAVKLGALLQDSERQGTDEIHQLPGLGEFEQDSLPGTGTYERKTQAYSATVNAKLGPVELVSATGYSIDKINTRFDSSPAFGATGLVSLFFPGVTGSMNPYEGETKKFTQEVRLTIPLGQKVEWLVGAFYTDEDYVQDLEVLAADSATGAPVGTLLGLHIPNSFEETAAFTALTFEITDRFDIQLGGRISENKQSFLTDRTGPLASGNSPEARTKDSPFTYLITPRFRISPDLMAYARMASGYRPGGPNANCAPTNTIPCQYDADTTDNYEIGLKGRILDRALSFDASVYYINWKDIQLNATDPSFFLAYTGNGGSARSRGAELSLEARPLTGLTVSAWVAWNDAELRQTPLLGTFNGVVGAGDRLPYSSPLSGSLSLNQEFPLSASMTGFVGASASYVDNRKGAFPGFFSPTSERELFPAYVQMDLSAGVRYDTWAINLFVNNVSDERGVLTGGLDKGGQHTFAYNYIQPRTVGVSLVKTF
jgi:outer membrane receptor protein involved in Fe transport